MFRLYHRRPNKHQQFLENLIFDKPSHNLLKLNLIKKRRVVQLHFHGIFRVGN